MEPLVRCAAAGAEELGCLVLGQLYTVLAYADDLVLLARGPETLQEMLDSVVVVAQWAGLRFKPCKCATLHLGGRGTRKGALPTVLRVGGEPVRALVEGVPYRHLGVPTGYRVVQTLEAAIAALTADLDLVASSLLVPWQKVDAVRTFLHSFLQFILRGGRVRKTALADCDRHLRAHTKLWLNLPHRASPLLTHIPPVDGGMGILPLGEQADAATVTHAFRLLSSADPPVRALAWAKLWAAVTRKAALPEDAVTEALLAQYLKGSTAAPLSRDPGATESLWTYTRNAGSRLHALAGISWHWCVVLQELQLELPMPGSCDPDRAVRHFASFPTKAAFWTRSAVPRRSHFLRTGQFTQFAEWRFVHRARLNVVPLNGARHGGYQRDRACRRCGYWTETLAHVGTQVRVNHQVPHTDSLLRPDLVVISKARRTAYLVDVTVAFDNRYVSLEVARADKLRKYQVLHDQLRMRGYRAEVDAFVVGSLGSWDPANEGDGVDYGSPLGDGAAREPDVCAWIDPASQCQSGLSVAPQCPAADDLRQPMDRLASHEDRTLLRDCRWRGPMRSRRPATWQEPGRTGSPGPRWFHLPPPQGVVVPGTSAH
ncbi:uncharacterized protein LOC134527190 [Bacillus rossius redtenbacheri]|uniref:uncharacterized protein LOC134527190 n=1 Tax=Bacillus rossius redtenbacheri TaxID=93214 RepID=UPI002FDCFD57